MNEINFAIVGCGHIANKHAMGIKNTGGARLSAVCDTVSANMEPFVKEYKAKPYDNFDEMLTDPNIDVVNICTPSGTHAALATKAAEAKKHVIVEKPIALTLKDAYAIKEACERNNVKLAILHPNRFRPAMVEVKKKMDAGHFGKISHVNATVRWNRNQEYFDQAEWRGTKSLDGGVLMNQAIHNLDLMLWLMGDVEEVYSMSATRLRNIEAEDVSTGVVRFKGGALGVIEAATTIYPKNFEESLSIFGEKASVKIGGTTANFIEHWVMENMSDEDILKLKQKIEINPYGKPGHECIIEDMILAIKENRDPIVTGEDGIKALQLVAGLYQSAEVNEPLLASEIK